MNLIVEAIKIDEIEIGEITEKSNIYVAKILYNDLNKVCKLGNVSINREVDNDRAEKMVEYIKTKGSFYPTLVAATTKKNIIDYNEKKKNIEIKIKDEQDKFIVLDGQHRFQSINYLLKEEGNIERYQSVLLIENMNNFQQRKTFLDINDTPRRVTTGTKLRFDKTIANYYSLSFIDKRDNVLKYILMDDNQTANNEKIPYKYIVKFNDKLISIISKEFKKGKLKFTQIDSYKKSILIINGILADIIEQSQKNDDQITRYELFYTVLGELLSLYIEESFTNGCEIDVSKVEEDLNLVKEHLSEISSGFLENIPTNQSLKKEKIKDLICNVLGRE